MLGSRVPAGSLLIAGSGLKIPDSRPPYGEGAVGFQERAEGVQWG